MFNLSPSASVSTVSAYPRVPTLETCVLTDAHPAEKGVNGVFGSDGVDGRVSGVVGSSEFEQFVSQLILLLA